MKNYPPGTDQLVVPTGIPFLFLFVNAPACYRQAKAQKAAGYYNHLVLPKPDRFYHYQWPVAGCGVIVLVYGTIAARLEADLIAALCHYGATEVVVRHPPDKALLIRRPRL